MLAELVFADMARQVNTRPPEVDRQTVALLDAIRDPRWRGKTLLVPQGYIPTLHFYFQDIVFRGYAGHASGFDGACCAQFGGVVYPNEAAVRVP